jgi:hypothetical protein
MSEFLSYLESSPFAIVFRTSPEVIVASGRDAVRPSHRRELIYGTEVCRYLL